MEQNHLDGLGLWFEKYVRAYLDTDSEGHKNIALKVEHTRKVCEMMDQLTAGEGLFPRECLLAGAVALLHDVGRFPQYRRWRTFRDSISDNHARLGVEVIREQKLLDDLPPEERLLIEEAVRFHNLLSMPSQLKSSTDLFLRLIRDADKLDIWRVFAELFSLPAHERASAALLDLPDLAEVTPVCAAALANRQVVRLGTVAYVNDFRLLMMSWTYDLNFGTSFKLLLNRGYLDVLSVGLPDNPAVRSAVASVREYLVEKTRFV